MLIVSGLFLFLAHLGSRRQFRYEGMHCKGWLYNIARISRRVITRVPHGDTIAYLLERLAVEHLAMIRTYMISRLIRMKALDKYRLFGNVLIAVDGTGTIYYSRRHCPYCLTRTVNGKTSYYHHVLEAKLVTWSGLALSIETEFIENLSPGMTKQDCELNAFKRMVKRLKKAFPRLPICLLLDSLYANQSVFQICQDHRWDYIITLKEGSIPSLFQEFEAITALEPGNRTTGVWRKKKQVLTWANAIPYHNHSLNIFDCREGGKRFAWVTNMTINRDTVRHVANKGGRQRWKIENQGFNTQKNAGMAMEHPYSNHPNASKSFYILLQIAHMIIQLMTHGLLAKNFSQTWGSFRNFTRRLAEALRVTLIPEEIFSPSGSGNIQIRLDSS